MCLGHKSNLGDLLYYVGEHLGKILVTYKKYLGVKKVSSVLLLYRIVHYHGTKQLKKYITGYI